MIEIIFLIALLIFMGGIVFSRRDRFEAPGTKRAHDGTFKAFEKADSVFVTSQEHQFFQLMQSKLPDGYFLHAKVRLEDIVGVKPEIKNERMRWHLRARVKSRHVDFLLTNAKGSPLCAIELDGSSHLGQSAMNADALKDGIFKAVEIPLIRISTGEVLNSRVEKIIQSLSAF